MADKLIGKWKLMKADNIEEYMTDAKFSNILKRIFRALTVTLQIVKISDEEWQVNFLTSFRDIKQKFKVNEKIKKKTAVGTLVMCVYRFEGDKLLYDEESLKEGQVASRSVYQVTDDGRLHQVSSTKPNNVTMDRWYTRIPDPQ